MSATGAAGARAPLDPQLFCADLAEDPIGAGARVRSPLAPTWFAPATLAAMHDHFAASEPPHALLLGALPHSRALRVAAALASSRFVPHEHAAYPLDVSRGPQLAGPARRFVDWLATAAAARLHMRLVGVAPDRRIVQTQVHVSRMTCGQRFPRHIDSGQDTLAVVYFFGRDVRGGVLCFSGPDGRALLRVAPMFNQAVVFFARNRPHEVEPVQWGTRYAITAFWVVD